MEINTPGGFEGFHLDAGDPATHDGIPEQGPPDIERMAAAHRDHGLESIETTEYAGTHWLGTFAAWMILHWERPLGS